MIRTPIEDLRFNTLAAIPSLFGKIVYLANLRNEETGMYEHYGLAMVFGEKEAEKALKISHQESFQEWLTCGMKEQKKDLEVYLSTVRDGTDSWLKSTCFQEFTPQNCRALEKQMFSDDLKQVLNILKAERARQQIHPTTLQLRSLGQ